MKIHESAEMYLETILILQNRNGNVRSIDIVREMGFSRPTVSVAVKNLVSTGYLEIDNGKLIKLTPKGLQIATNIYERHTVLTSMLLKLGVSEANAKADACKIEHDLSNETFECIKKHINAI